MSIGTIRKKAKEKLRVKCRLKDRLLNLLLEFCLDIFHEDEVSEYLFFMCESSVCMVGDTIESRVTHEHIAYYHHDHAADEWYDEYHPVSLELIESEIRIDVLELIEGIHMWMDYSTSSAKMIYRSSVVPTGQQVIMESSFLSGSRAESTRVSPGSTVALSVIR